MSLRGQPILVASITQINEPRRNFEKENLPKRERQREI
jgi:hypothetical protein